MRRRSLKAMPDHGEQVPTTGDFDDVRRETLSKLLAEPSLDMRRPEDHRNVRWDVMHRLKRRCDFSGVLLLW